ELLDLVHLGGISSVKALQNRTQETAVPIDRGPVVLSNSFFHRALNLRSNQLDPPHEHPSGLRRSGLDLKRQDRINRARRDNVDQARALLEPGIPPGLDHRLSLLRKQTFRDQRGPQLAPHLWQGAMQRWPLGRD